MDGKVILFLETPIFTWVVVRKFRSLNMLSVFLVYGIKKYF